MFCVLILILISISVDCVDWCPYVKPNGNYKGLRIYRRYLDSEGKAELVMNNRDRYEWLFELRKPGKDGKYLIDFRNETIKSIDETRVFHRFGIVVQITGIYLNCAVETPVENRVLSYVVFNNIIVFVDNWRQSGPHSMQWY